MTVLTPKVDDLDAALSRLPDDAEVTLPARVLREVVAEARGIEEDVITEWMEATDPCQVIG